MALQIKPSAVLRACSIAVLLALVILAAGLTAVQVQASSRTLAVTTTDDGHQDAGTTCASPAAGGACTLRAAIELADKESGDTIAVPAGTYDLDATLGFLDVESSMTINGVGSAATVIDGGGATGVFGVGRGTVSISGLTVRNGAVPGGFDGADIANDGSLSLADVAVTGGSAPQSLGGGIASSGPLTLRDVVVSGNHAGDGGGIALLGDARATITGSTISGNSADGALFGIPGGRGFQLPGHGGGILLTTLGGTLSLEVTGSAISGNTARGPALSDPIVQSPEGGGIFNLGATLRLANDTVAGNTAADDNGGTVGPAAGGGILQTDVFGPSPVSGARTNAPRPRLGALEAGAVTAIRAATAAPPSSAATTTLDFVTVAGNDAGRFGGVAALAGTFRVANSIVAGNRGGNCGSPSGITSTGYNVESGEDCGFRQTGDQFDVDPRLDALKVNAPGVTATMALLPDSPAIDAADPRCDQKVDQRGVSRPQGPRSDIGAFEVVQTSTTCNPSPTSSTSPTAPPSPPVTGASPAASLRRVPVTASALLSLVVVAVLGGGLALSRRRPTGE